MSDTTNRHVGPVPDFDAIAQGDNKAIAHALRLLWRDHDSVHDQIDAVIAMFTARGDELEARLDAAHAPRAE